MSLINSKIQRNKEFRDYHVGDVLPIMMLTEGILRKLEESSSRPKVPVNIVSITNIETLGDEHIKITFDNGYSIRPAGDSEGCVVKTHNPITGQTIFLGVFPNNPDKSEFFIERAINIKNRIIR